MTRVANKYDKEQEKHLGLVSQNQKLTLGLTGNVSIVGDSLMYTNEGSNPRWLNLTPIIGNLTWSSQQSGPWNVVLPLAPSYANVIPTNAQGGCVLNPVSFKFIQFTNGILQCSDAYSWSCYVTFKVLWNLTVAGEYITFKLTKNGAFVGVETGLPSITTPSGLVSYTDGWVSINNGDFIGLQATNSDNAGRTLQVYGFSINVMAIRLLT